MACAIARLRSSSCQAAAITRSSASTAGPSFGSAALSATAARLTVRSTTAPSRSSRVGSDRRDARLAAALEQNLGGVQDRLDVALGGCPPVVRDRLRHLPLNVYRQRETR